MRLVRECAARGVKDAASQSMFNRQERKVVEVSSSLVGKGQKPRLRHTTRKSLQLVP